MATAQKKDLPVRLPTNAIGGSKQKRVRPFGVNGALGCKFESATSHHDHGPAEKESQEPA